MILPHHLVQHLARSGHLEAAGLSMEDVRQYWDHMGRHAAWGASHPAVGSARHMPMFLYGDDARFNSFGDKLLIVCCGFVLDQRKSSLLTHFPLFLLKEAGHHQVMRHANRLWNDCEQCKWKLKYFAQGLSLGFRTVQAFMKPAPGPT